jgi:hypothetical protein
MSVERSGGKLLVFHVRGKNDSGRIEFKVKAYSHSPWIFKRRAAGFLPSKLNYNEYPIIISDLKYESTKTGKNITLDDLGVSMGNAEHAWGLLF